MVHLKEKQIITYLSEKKTSRLNLKNFVRITPIFRSQWNLSANFAYNPRIYHLTYSLLHGIN